MCIVKRIKKPLNELFRIVRLPSGAIVIENDKHLLGRGAYISKDVESINIAKKKKMLSRALKCEVSDDIYDQLLARC